MRAISLPITAAFSSAGNRAADQLTLNHYCTYFDSGYLAQGVALWHSLRREDPRAVLWVLALDDIAERALIAMGEESLKVLSLPDVLARDAELASCRARPRAQFIFALTPCLLRQVFAAATQVDSLIYLDADLYFFSDPRPIWEELSRGSVLVVPHRYPPWQDDARFYGRFNVGVVGFVRDQRAAACLDWWRTCCLQSTELAANGVHFGDQKYLDEWPVRFAGVVECHHLGINVAPWNWAAVRFAFERENESITVNGQPLVVFHFAQFRWLAGRWFDSGQLEYGIMPRGLRSRLYGEYWSALLKAESVIKQVQPDFSIPQKGWRAVMKPWHLAVLRLFWGQLWWRAGRTWWSGRGGLGRFSGRALALWRRWERRGG